MVAGLEAAVEVHQERMSGRVDHLKDPLLAHEAAEQQLRLTRVTLNFIHFLDLYNKLPPSNLAECFERGFTVSFKVLAHIEEH